MEKYLVIDNTNGDGYTSPSISVLKNRPSALSLYHEYIGINVTSNLKLLETGFDGNHLFTTFCSVDEDDEEIDHYGCHMFEVSKPKTIVMICDYANEFLEFDGETVDEIVEDLGIVANKEDEFEFWIEEDSHAACITHVTCQDSGTHYIIIQIK